MLGIKTCFPAACALILMAMGSAEMQAAKMQASKPSGATLTSSGFKNAQTMSKEFTGEGADYSPPLAWSGLPANAASLAVVCFDPDAPKGVWYHWLLFNLPSSMKSLPLNVPKRNTVLSGAAQGTNDFQKVGYNGPMPPPGLLHHYHFRVIALNSKLNVAPGASKEEVLKAMGGHILGQAELVGTYQR